MTILFFCTRVEKNHRNATILVHFLSLLQKKRVKCNAIVAEQTASNVPIAVARMKIHEPTSCHVGAGGEIGQFITEALINAGQLVIGVGRSEASNADLTAKFDTDCFSDGYYYEPKNGELLIFPSWLVHYVPSNFTHEDRLSLSFDLV